MTEPRHDDAVLSRSGKPGPYAAVLGGEAAIARRKEHEWQLRAHQIFSVFLEASKSSNESKKRTLCATLASIKASEAEYNERRRVYGRELKNPNPTIEYKQVHEIFRHVYALSIKWSNLSDINLLGCCPFPALTELRMEANLIEDIAAIGCFSELKELYMHGNRIEDISALRSLKKLEKLHFTGNRVTDLSPLKNLQNLDSIWLNDGISDITPLANLKLKLLYAQDCPLDQKSRRVVKQMRDRGTVVYAAGTRKSLR